MYKLNFKKRVWIAKQIISGTSVTKVAQAQKVSQTLGTGNLQTLAADLKKLSQSFQEG